MSDFDKWWRRYPYHGDEILLQHCSISHWCPSLIQCTNDSDIPLNKIDLQPQSLVWGHISGTGTISGTTRLQLSNFSYLITFAGDISIWYQTLVSWRHSVEGMSMLNFTISLITIYKQHWNFQFGFYHAPSGATERPRNRTSRTEQPAVQQNVIDGEAAQQNVIDAAAVQQNVIDLASKKRCDFCLRYATNFGTFRTIAYTARHLVVQSGV